MLYICTVLQPIVFESTSAEDALRSQVPITWATPLLARHHQQKRAWRGTLQVWTGSTRRSCGDLGADVPSLLPPDDVAGGVKARPLQANQAQDSGR